MMDMTRGHRFTRPDSESSIACIGCGDPWSDEFFPARECPNPAPEVRLGPDGDVAIRNGGSPYAPWRVTNGGHYSDADVSEWTPLLPVSNKDSVT